MQLLDRYLAAVRKSLPGKNEDDIIAEISDDLQSQGEAKQAQLGRPLTLDEESAMLKAYGNPRLVASRYGGAPYLIGPSFLPFYWSTLRIVLILSIVITLFVAFALPGTPLQSLAYFWSSITMTVLTVVGGVTIVFALLEYAQRRFGRDIIGINAWNPRKLPPAGQCVMLSQSITELVINLAIIGWMVSSPWVRHALLYFTLGPIPNESLNRSHHLSMVWQQVMLPFFLLFLASALLNIVNIARQDWYALRACAHAGINVGFALTAAYLWLHDLVVASPAYRHTAQAIAEAQGLNFIAHWVVACMAVGCLIVAYFDLRPLRHIKQQALTTTANGVA